MRILISGFINDTLPPPYAGIPKRALLLARYWREQGHEVGLTFVHHQKQEDDLDARASYFFEFPKRPSKWTKLRRILRCLVQHPVMYLRNLLAYREVYGYLSREAVLFSSYGIFIDRVIKEFRPDVLLCESALIHTFMVSRVAERRQVPVVIDTYAEMHAASMKITDRMGSRREAFWKTFLSNTQLIVAPSEYCAQGPRTYFPADRVRVIYSGIEVEKYARMLDAKKEEMRSYFHLPQTAFVALAVGAYTPRKGHDQLIEAAAQLNAKGINVHVALCGAGDAAWLQQLAQDKGIADRVHIFQKLSELELIQLYRSADVYVDASNTPRACLGMSLTEAMAVGLPTIAYRLGGLPEVVHDGENGILVTPDDVQELAEAINRMRTSSDDERARMGREGLRLAQELVDVQRTSHRMSAVLEEAIQMHRQSSAKK